jgi:hypothetical protein
MIILALILVLCFPCKLSLLEIKDYLFKLLNFTHQMLLARAVMLLSLEKLQVLRYILA